MKRSLALLAAFILSLSSISTLNCFADETDVKIVEEIALRYVGIDSISHYFDISSNGTATCYGTTRSSSGYTAKVKVELQRKKSGSWSTIKSWTATNSSYAVIDKEYSVTSGYSYRLKVTHSALDGNGTVQSSVTNYSTIHSYWNSKDKEVILWKKAISEI